ncbi:hypothetical protein [Methylobacterium sp.]|uniref:hypothetical protein n=1 Tax=Methylobacterium sp. TaxID=409 RepID=UPI003B02B918
MTVLRIQTKAPRKHDISGHLRTCEVESAAINAIAGLEDARRTVAATRLAYERLPRIGSLIGERAWSFHVSAAEVEALSRAERLLGVGYPEAEQEVARLDALPCEPYADEVACGLFEAVRWLGHPTNIVLFGISADQGWGL